MTFILPGKKHFIAIGLLSLSMIALQILVTRIFSVVFYYHFAFAGVTFAMLGLTTGALKVYFDPSRFTPETVNRECAQYALRAALLLVLSTLAVVDIGGRFFEIANLWEGEGVDFLIMTGWVVLFLGATMFIPAFTAIGVCVTLLLTYFPSHTNRLYATDLICAALGCVVVLLGLKLLDPVSLLLLLATCLALLAVALPDREPGKRLGRHALVAVAALGLLTAGQSISSLNGQPVFHLRIGKLQPLGEKMFERWNSYTHIAIDAHPIHSPFGWGFGTNLPKEAYTDVEQHMLRIDADAGTVLTRFSGDFDRVGHLKYDVINSGYHLRPIGHAAVIGIGGGRDILSALTFGVPKITGVEINPAIFEALNEVFADYTGHLATYPGVRLVNAEARSYLNAQDNTYDLIQISLIDTWAATVAGGLALSENKLYTREAWNEFLAHLNPHGMLSVSRWFNKEHRGELYRMISLAHDSLKKMDPGIDPRQHVLVLSANDVVTLLLSKSPFSEEEMRRADEFSKVYGFTLLISPQQADDKTVQTLLSGHGTPEYYASQPLDLSAPSDDRPFFFNMIRLRDVLFTRMEGYGRNASNNIATYVLFGLSALVLLNLAYAVLVPLWRLYGRNRPAFSGSRPYIAYFTFIGLGFMFIEMALMQWLMIFLGHPVYALSVVLFTLLLFSGIGSYTVNYDRLRPRTYLLRATLLCLLLAATFVLVMGLRETLAHHETAMRILMAVILLAPVSLFMGMLFPLGVAAARREHAELLPWFWALNGAASVFASIFSVVIAMSYGGSATYLAGLACYALCWMLCLGFARQPAKP